MKTSNRLLLSWLKSRSGKNRDQRYTLLQLKNRSAGVLRHSTTAGVISLLFTRSPWKDLIHFSPDWTSFEVHYFRSRKNPAIFPWNTGRLLVFYVQFLRWFLTHKIETKAMLLTDICRKTTLSYILQYVSTFSADFFLIEGTTAKLKYLSIQVLQISTVIPALFLSSANKQRFLTPALQKTTDYK